MKKCIVVTRHLSSAWPVTHSVTVVNTQDKDFDIDDYAKELLESEKKKFLSNFPEFQGADWYVAVVSASEIFI